MEKRIVVLLVALVLALGSLSVFSQEMVEVDGGEMFSMFQRNFPWLDAGKDLFVTTGVYTVYPLHSYLRVFTAVRARSDFPSCRFKAATVALGELHEQLGNLVAAGYGMSEDFPPWFVIFIATDCGTINLYGYDIAEGRLLGSVPRISLVLF